MSSESCEKATESEDGEGGYGRDVDVVEDGIGLDVNGLGVRGVGV